MQIKLWRTTGLEPAGHAKRGLLRPPPLHAQFELNLSPKMCPPMCCKPFPPIQHNHISHKKENRNGARSASNLYGSTARGNGNPHGATARGAAQNVVSRGRHARTTVDCSDTGHCTSLPNLSPRPLLESSKKNLLKHQKKTRDEVTHSHTCTGMQAGMKAAHLQPLRRARTA